MRETGRIFALALVVVALSLALGWVASNKPLRAKLAGRASACPVETLTWSKDANREQEQLYAKYLDQAEVVDSEGELDLVAVPDHRRFWVQRNRSDPSESLIAYLLADHETIGKRHAADTVKPGEVVMDVGAHCGVFVDFALRRGASKVIAIEPDPVSVESLRRNFRAEIEAGRVVVVPKGAWSSDAVLPLGRGIANSGSNSVVFHDEGWAGPTIDVPLAPIDKMAAELHIAKLDFVKMDIEGAERDALKGMAATIARFHPRFMLDSYHRNDDLPAFRSILSGYSLTPGRCDGNPAREFRPQVTFWRAH